MSQIDDEHCHTRTHPLFKNWQHWLHDPVVQDVYLQPSTTLQISTPKRAEQTHKPIALNTCKDFLKIPSLWEAAGNQPKMLLNQLGIKCPSDSFITVLPIVNGGDWGCIVHDLETIIVLVLLSFYFITQSSHHSITSLWSWFSDSATVTLMSGDITTDNKMESSA